MMDSWIGLLLWCKKPERRLNKMTAEFCLSGKIRMHGLADLVYDFLNKKEGVKFSNMGGAKGFLD